MKPTLAILGGSFDPPHVAHVLLGAYAACVEEIDELLVIPTYAHALGKRHHASYEDRFAMTELAFEGLRRARVSDVERQLGGASFTLHTLEALQRERPDAALRLIIGADILAEADRWHRFDEVRRLAPPIVIGRQGFEHDARFTLPAISSTSIRERLARGESVDGELPWRVIRYIEAHALYQESSL